MQGVALVGVFLRVSPFAAAAGFDRERCSTAVRERLGRFFGKRGGAVIDANLEIITAAYDGLIDVTRGPAGRARAARAGRSRPMTTARRFATVADVMAIAPVSVRASASLTEAARLLDEHHISGLPVVDAAARWSASCRRPTCRASGPPSTCGRIGTGWPSAT